MRTTLLKLLPMTGLIAMALPSCTSDCCRAYTRNPQTYEEDGYTYIDFMHVYQCEEDQETPQDWASFMNNYCDGNPYFVCECD